MTFWTNFWTVVLLGGVTLFVVLAVVVTVGGLYDIRSLFRSIKAQHEESRRASDSESDRPRRP